MRVKRIMATFALGFVCSYSVADDAAVVTWLEQDGSLLEIVSQDASGTHLRIDPRGENVWSGTVRSEELDLVLSRTSAFVIDVPEFPARSCLSLDWLGADGTHVPLVQMRSGGRHTVPFCLGQKRTPAGGEFGEGLPGSLRGHLRLGLCGPMDRVSECRLSSVRFEAALEVRRPYPLGFSDLDGDGDPDLLRMRRQQYDIICVDDDDDMTRQDAAGDKDSDLVVVDTNMDGVYDGPGDFVYDPVDVDGDGDADYEFSCTQWLGHSAGLRYADYDDDNRMAWLDFENFVYPEEQSYSEIGSYRFDYAGNGFFLKKPLYSAGSELTNPEIFWENPIAWYDPDDDGFTEIVIRSPDTGDPDGRLDAFELAFDADNDTTVHNQSDLDWQLTFQMRGAEGGPDYAQIGRFHYPGIRGLEAVNDVLFKRSPWFRTTEYWVHFPFFGAIELGTNHPAWRSCFLVVDEDDEDNRWEEMFSPHESGDRAAFYDDKIGDRWETDNDFSGKGQLYRAAFDGRLHLYGAEKGEWTVDYHGLYHGALDRVIGTGFVDPPMPPARKGPDGKPISIWRLKKSDIILKFPRVRYSDTDGNGFIDRIEYDDDGEADSIERTVSLLDFASADNPHPDVSPLWDLRPRAGEAGAVRPEEWDGKRIRFRSDVYDRVRADTDGWAERNWKDALSLFRAARNAGLTVSENDPECDLAPDATFDQRARAATYLVRPGYAGLLHAETTAEKIRNAYWLKEKVFADILRGTPDGQRRRRYAALYYTGRIDELAALCGRPDATDAAATGGPEDAQFEGR